ncbi:MAG: GtrA family protein [Rhodospirillales bacterium]|jgi:putative flippase GtrA|nr:GtrA family protein [Rhodospirillales bacterium]
MPAEPLLTGSLDGGGPVRPRRLPRLVRFAIVGVANTAIDFSIFAVLFYLVHWPLLAAHAMGFAVAVVNSYVCNKAWTFRDRQPSRLQDGAKFLLVAICGLLTGSVVIALAAQLMPAFAAKACAVAATFAVNYWASARYVFVVRRLAP